MIKNIIAVFERAMEHDKIDWYENTNNWCMTISSEMGVKMSVFVGVVAALSPMKSWKENQRIAVEFIRSGGNSPLHTKTMLKKAGMILASSGSDEEILEILHGEKISSFYKNIMYHTENTSVTIDRHAIAIAHNRYLSDKKRAEYLNGRYDIYEDAYKKAAKILNCSPHYLQGVTWVTWRKNGQLELIF